MIRPRIFVPLFVSLALFAALPVASADSGNADTTQSAVPGSYDWSDTGNESQGMARLPDERAGPAGLLVPILGALLALSATGLGLTITTLSLRREMRQRRVVYRTRGQVSRSTAA
jgi:hypothetical protein